MSSASLRNFEQIQEQEPRPRPSLWLTAGLGTVVLGLFVALGLTFTNRGSSQKALKPDPLEQLVQQGRAQVPQPKLTPAEVTFPKVLSDHRGDTTALAALRDDRGQLLPSSPEAQGDTKAPEWVAQVAPTLPKRAQATGDLLNSSSVTLIPKDPLTALAAEVNQPPEGTVAAEMGNDGGVQIQVASFKGKEEADALVVALRQRGHKAFRIAAELPGRGTWHRVRIGPFRTKFEAERYRRKFEAEERLSPYVVDPEQVRRAAEIREQKLKAQAEKQKTR